MSKIEIKGNTGGNGSAYYRYADNEIGFIRQISRSDLVLYERYEIIPDMRTFLPDEYEGEDIIVDDEDY